MIIFLLGWPLEWTEIIVIFMPIFIPLLDNFGVDPLFFGLLVALNLQTAFLSPPVAMAAFYLKGVGPPHVTLNQIFAGMLPFMAFRSWRWRCSISSRGLVCGCRRCVSVGGDRNFLVPERSCAISIVRWCWVGSVGPLFHGRNPMAQANEMDGVRVVMSAPQLAAVLAHRSISPTEMMSNRLWGGLGHRRPACWRWWVPGCCALRRNRLA